MRERSMRQDVVERGECEVKVDWWGAEGWGKGVREEVGRLKEVEFRIGGEGFHLMGVE